MRLLLALAAVAGALAAAGTAFAGGWATVGLGSLPDGIVAGETWKAQVTVLRHGRTPTDGAKPTVTIRNEQTGRRLTFPARPTWRTGVYEARVVFPEAGSWRFEIDNGLAATGYGVSQTTTYAPVRIVPGDDGGGFPVWPIPVGAAALALAAVVHRRLRRAGGRVGRESLSA